MVERDSTTGGTATAGGTKSTDIEFLFPGHMGIVDGAENVKRNFQLVIQQIFPYI